MRIVSGQFRGRRFSPPAKKWPTRPTTDFAKEGLFNILTNLIDFSETTMLDLFGGTGSHTYEAISRGCRDVTYVDKHGPCCKFVKKIAIDLDITSNITIVQCDAGKYMKSCSANFDYIFAGPPYPLIWLSSIPALVFQYQLLSTDGLFVLEHNHHHDFSKHHHFSQVRKYGDTFFSFFQSDIDIDT